MPRRSPATGQVFFKSSTRQWVVRAGGVERTSKRWRTRRDATAALAALQSALTAPEPPTPVSSLTLAAYLPTWLSGIRHRLRPESITTYDAALAMWLPTLGDCPLDQLTPQHCRLALGDLLTPTAPGVRAYAPSTVVKARAILSMALADAVDDELIARNPLRRVPPPRVPEPEPRPFTVPEVRAILASVQDTPLVAAVTLTCCYGLRAGEVCGLQWSDVTETTVSIVRQHPGSGTGHRPTKTPAATRTLPLIPVVTQALARARMCSPSEHIVPYRRESLGRLWRQHIERTGLPRRTFHELRHAAVTLLAALGVDEQVRMLVVGHSGVAVHRRYRGVSGADLSEALDKLSVVLNVVLARTGHPASLPRDGFQ